MPVAPACDRLKMKIERTERARKYCLFYSTVCVILSFMSFKFIIKNDNFFNYIFLINICVAILNIISLTSIYDQSVNFTKTLLKINVVYGKFLWISNILICFCAVCAINFVFPEFLGYFTADDHIFYFVYSLIFYILGSNIENIVKILEVRINNM